MAAEGAGRMRTVRRIGLGILVLLALAQLRHLLGEHTFGDAVGVLELKGVIDDTADLVDAVDDLRTDPHTVALVLRIDSPGGAVAPSQDLYTAIER